MKRTASREPGERGVLALVLGLITFIGISCGGGGGGGGEGTPPPPPVPTPVRLSADTPAGVSSLRTAYNNSGTGLAVWVLDNGTRGGLYYAVYSTGAWSGERLLLIDVTDADLALASNGTDFMLVWARRARGGGYFPVSSKRYDPASGTWTDLAGPGNSNLYEGVPYQPQVASDSEGYAVVWWQLLEGSGVQPDQAFGNVYSNGTWTGQTPLEDSTLGSHSPQIAGTQGGYCVVWEGGGIYARVYRTLQGAWDDGPTLLGSMAGGQVVHTPSVALGGADRLNCAVVWRQEPPAAGDNIYASILPVITLSTTTWQAPVRIENGTNALYTEPKIAGTPAGFSAVWATRSGPLTHSIEANIFTFTTTTQGSWQMDAGDPAPAVLAGNALMIRDPLIATNGTGYSVVWVGGGAIPGNDAVVARTYNGSTWLPADVIEDTTGDVWEPRIVRSGSGYGAIWLVEEFPVGTRKVHASIGNAGNWTEPASLNQPRKGTSTAAALATHRNGVSVAVWLQVHGDVFRTYGNIYSSGSWSTPFVISSSVSAHALPVAPVVATNGTDFLVVYDQNGILTSRSCTTSGILGSEGQIGSSGSVDAMRIAASSTGYGVAWTRRAGGTHQLYANVYSSGTWTAPVLLKQLDYPLLYDVQIASDGEGFAVVWHQPAPVIETNIFSNGAWQQDATVIGNGFRPSIAGNASGYGIVWQNGTDIYAKVRTLDAWQTEATLIGRNADPSYKPLIASNGTGYAAMWAQASNFENIVTASIYDGASWQLDGSGDPAPTALEALAGHAQDIRIASNGTGYAAVWRQWIDNDCYLVANKHTAGGWQQDSAGHPRPATVARSVDLFSESLTLAAGSSTYNAVWGQTANDDADIRNIYSRMGF